MSKIITTLAFLVGLSAGAQAQIPLLTGPADPSQLISTVNQLISAINASAFSQAFPQPPAASGGMSSVPNSITLTSAATGVPPLISPSLTADTNTSLQISPKGSGNLILFNIPGQPPETGVLQFANTQSFVPIGGFAACPGFQGGAGARPAGISQTMQGYLVFQDVWGKTHYVPSC